MNNIKFSDVALILATLLGPVLAVQAQKWLERLREAQNRRLLIFKTLMSTRASRLSPAHVEALNMIDVEFYSKKYKKVTDAWKEYRDHLTSLPKDSPEDDVKLWHSKIEGYLADLLFVMGESIGYEFDKVHIKRATYIPQGLGEIEEELHTIRKALASILTGKTQSL